jgi:hypothetical protein
MSEENKSTAPKNEEKAPVSLTIEQINEIKTYPTYWQSILTEAAERGESIKETYEELKPLENLF